jgi:stage II sporulation protein AA (anti-sigma F factor antagonist)
MAIDWSDSIAIAELSDEPALSEELGTLIQRVLAMDSARVPHVVLNFANVTYLNSSNLAQLLRLRKRMIEVGRTLKICSVSDEVWSIMLVTGLEKVFRFAPDMVTALAGLQLEQSDEA